MTASASDWRPYGVVPPAGLLEQAESEATLATHREWVAAGRPGAVSHEEAMTELLGEQ